MVLLEVCVEDCAGIATAAGDRWAPASRQKAGRQRVAQAPGAGCGADRLELCACLAVGGLTPSTGVRQALPARLPPAARP